MTHDAELQNGDGPAVAQKPKRVRTGCLTCRERHLKCDEAVPNCNNCKKSNRECKRGVRLNFIDTWVERPAKILSQFGTKDWRVDFLDESRDIASEYVGGLAKYKRPSGPGIDEIPPVPPLHDQPHGMDIQLQLPPTPVQQHASLPPITAMTDQQFYDSRQQPPPADVDGNVESKTHIHRLQQHSHDVFQPQAPDSGSSSHGSQFPTNIPGNNITNGAISSFPTTDIAIKDQEEESKREYLDNQEETLFMQVFVEEVGLWMDSMDSLKHFSRLLPFHSLSEPMLINAFLACGARHLTLVNPAYTEEKALHYYDTATRFLLKNLQNPNRDTVICATTAVILNVYEVMSERALQRMNHIAGARALIKECGWNARATGIGAACFWLNVGLEVLSCLHFNWQCAWDPDDWGLQLDLTRETTNGREEVWTHRMLYIVAKICNFRATMPRFRDPDERTEQIRMQQRYEEWCRLKSLCDAWNDGIPRTMHPMAYLFPYQTSSKSAFPEVWLVKRTTIVARLFYHTGMLLLAQVNPYYGSDNGDMAEMQARHSQMICGIAAHVKDRGVASVAIRSLAHAAEVLTDRREQEEVLQIFDKIYRETGWRIGFVYKELKQKWKWDDAHLSPEQYMQTHEADRLKKEKQQQLEQHPPAAQSMQPQHQGYEFVKQQQQQPQSQQTQQLMAPQQQLAPPPMLPTPPTSSGKRPPAGIPNPLYAKADFTLPQHPYQQYYVAPFGGGQANSQFFNAMY